MRDFETDRPDITESAYSVDAGHFQLETDLFKTEHVKASWDARGGPGISLDAGLERPCGVVQPGLRSPDGKFGSYRHLGDREPEVVVKDQDCAGSPRR